MRTTAYDLLALGLRVRGIPRRHIHLERFGF
jgi:hypothetical protein